MFIVICISKGIADRVGAAGKNLVFSKTKTKFCLSLQCNGYESYLNVNKTGICKFEANDSISWCNFCLRAVSKDFTKVEQSKISLVGTVCTVFLT